MLTFTGLELYKKAGVENFDKHRLSSNVGSDGWQRFNKQFYLQPVRHMHLIFPVKHGKD